MKIAVIGTGYIGLVSGVCLAKLGHNVICVDTDAAKIMGLQAGEVPIFEPGLAAFMHEACASGLLHFSTDTQAATRASDAVMIAVGTITNKIPNTLNQRLVYTCTASAFSQRLPVQTHRNVEIVSAILRTCRMELGSFSITKM